MRWLFISPLVLLIYGSVCFYTGIKLLFFIRFFFPALRVIMFWIPYVFLSCSFVIFNLLRHNLDFLRLGAFFWLVILLYLFMLFALSDLVRFGFYISGKKINNINMYTTGISILLCAIIMIYGVFHARTVKTVNYSLDLQGSGSDLRITLVSDIHISPSIGEAWVKRIVNNINFTQPDIVCFAGDIFDGNIDGIKNLQGVISQLKLINAPLGVYACLGNHDVDRISFSNASTTRIEEILSAAGIVVLIDDVKQVRENFYIAGRRDARTIGMNAERKTPDELLAGIKGTIIVMDHQPTQFPLLEKAGAALVLSGHTHTGQVFPGRFITRSMFTKAGGTDYGYWQGQTLQAVVTSGAAYWGPPVRIGTNSEIAIIDIRFEQ
jgi:predicted MPP superfamily phosphohydrolase